MDINYCNTLIRKLMNIDNNYHTVLCIKKYEDGTTDYTISEFSDKCDAIKFSNFQAYEYFPNKSNIVDYAIVIDKELYYNKENS